MGPFVVRHDKWPWSEQRARVDRELEVGDRVRMVWRYSIGGQHSTTWDRSAIVGDTGTVESMEGDGTVGVRWDICRNMGVSRVDASCFEIISPAQFQVGDRVRVRRRQRLTFESHDVSDQLGSDLYTREGTVLRVGSYGLGSHPLIGWDGGPQLVYDASCLERI